MSIKEKGSPLSEDLLNKTVDMVQNLTRQLHSLTQASDSDSGQLNNLQKHITNANFKCK